MSIVLSYRRRIVLTFSIVMALLCPYYNGFSQDIDLSDIEVEVTTRPRPELSVDEIYNKTILSLVWIVSVDGQDSNVFRQGSGVYCHRKFRPLP